MIILYVSIFLIILCTVFVNSVNAEVIEIITSRGNVFVLESSLYDTGISEISDMSDESATSTLDGLGIHSRLVHLDNSGSIIYGTANNHHEKSIRPYQHLSSPITYAGAILDGQTPQIFPINKFYKTWRYSENSLSIIPDTNFGYTAKHAINYLHHTDNSITVDPNIDVDATSIRDDIIIHGTGRIILKLNDYSNQTLHLRGQLSQDTVLRFVQSPYDLINVPYHKFQTHTSVGPSPVLLEGFNILHCTSCTNPFPLLAGSIHDSKKSGFVKIQLNGTEKTITLNPPSESTRYFPRFIVAASSFVFDSASTAYTSIISDSFDSTAFSDPSSRYTANKHWYYTFEHKDDSPAFSIYDTLPVKEFWSSMSGVLEHQGMFPNNNLLVSDSGEFSSQRIENTYMIVDSAGGHSEIHGTVGNSGVYFTGVGFPPNAAYKLVRDGKVMDSGVVELDGSISLYNDIFVQSSSDTVLYLYDDSLTYHNMHGINFDYLVFDHYNQETFTTMHKNNAGKIYHTYAYVKVPILGNVSITEINLNGEISLDYLTGNYTGGDTLLIPVIPTFSIMNFVINGLSTSLHISDILGGSPLKIADPIYNRITILQETDFIDSIEATAGATAYMIANVDGNAKAHLQASVSGSSEIQNIRTFEYLPPLPVLPQPRDPLTVWIEIYINGEQQMIQGQDGLQLYFSDTPDQNHSRAVIGTSSIYTARFSYPPVTISDTVSVPVKAGDFVEFYFYNKIYAHGSAPPLPPAAIETGRHGTASATAILNYASINTSM